MTYPSLSTLDMQADDIQEVAPASIVLWRRLGLRALPSHETMLIPTERLLVAGTNQLVRSAKRLVKSIQHVGILQPPSVVVKCGAGLHDPEATFEVIAGRRRVLAARLAGLPVVKCEAYAASTIPLSALLALIENEQRSAAWVREVEALRCLIDEGVGMTLDDLAAFGFDRATLAERLKIAQLPAPLLARVLAGNVSREVARKLVRLSQVQQARVAGLAETGEEITAERVNDLLRAQIGAGLLPLQAALAQGWDIAQPPHVHALLDHPSGGEERARETSDTKKGLSQEVSTSASPSPMLTLLAALHTFVQSPAYHTTPPPVQVLTGALEQELRLALREISPAPSSHVTVYHQREQKGV
jgi:ParB/RepB/Spo0J family partition protein